MISKASETSRPCVYNLAFYKSFSAKPRYFKWWLLGSNLIWANKQKGSIAGLGFAPVSHQADLSPLVSHFTENQVMIKGFSCFCCNLSMK